MIRGFYTALSSLVTSMTRMSVVADAVANVSTPGYKQPRTGEADFGLELVRSTGGGLGRLGTATYTTQTPLDPAQGGIETTGVPTDMAVDGDGLFVVRMAGGGRAYTRAGDFVVDARGQLSTQAGQAILDTQGRTITVNGQLTVAKDGTVEGTGQKIALVAWPADGLQRLGGNLFAADGTLPAATGAILQGALEHSNVDLASAMTELIGLQRQFSLASRALSSQEETLGEANQLGRLR